MDRKAQAATEYLIILAVVIIIALIVVAVMGGIPGVGKGAASRANAAYWSTADVAVTNQVISVNGTDSVMLKNNLRNPIRVTNLMIGGDAFTPTDVILPVGATGQFTGAITAPGCSAAGQAYSLDVSLTFTDTVTGASTTMSGEGSKLEGSCSA